MRLKVRGRVQVAAPPVDAAQHRNARHSPRGSRTDAEGVLHSTNTLHRCSSNNSTINTSNRTHISHITSSTSSIRSRYR